MSFGPDNLAGSVITAIVTATGTAFTTVFSLFKDLKKKVEELEKKVGSFESKTGLAFAITQIQETIRDLKRDQQEEKTPSSRRRRLSMLGIEELIETEGALPALVQKIRTLEGKIRDLEEVTQRLELKLKRAVSEEDFEAADRQRAEEISTVRTTVAEVKGLLQGLHMALGLTKR